MEEKELEAMGEALKLVPMKWRADFVRFVEEGEASTEFISFLEQDADVRRACEMLFRADEKMYEFFRGFA